jgi:hypothetical protein
MRKAILLGAIVGIAGLSLGCAMTDYPSLGDTNKSHGVIGCETGDRFGNTQQTLEPSTRDLFYTVKDPATGDAPCFPSTNAGNPPVSTDHVSHEDARDWNRFIGTYALRGEYQVFGGFGAGTYIAAGAKELADGTVRLNTFSSDATGSFSCVGNATNGLYGGPEGLVVGDGLGRSPRIPGLTLDNVVIDRSPTGAFGWCTNVAAVSTARAEAGFSLYYATADRGGEGQLWATPITRRGSMAAMLTGLEPIEGTWQGLDFTLHANLLEDGMLEVRIDRLTYDGTTYEATSEPRLSVRFRPETGLRVVEVHAENGAEVRSLASFLLNAGLADRAIDLSEPVLDLGLSFPAGQVVIVGDFLNGLVEDGGEGTAGF